MREAKPIVLAACTVWALGCTAAHNREPAAARAKLDDVVFTANQLPEPYRERNRLIHVSPDAYFDELTGRLYLRRTGQFVNSNGDPKSNLEALNVNDGSVAWQARGADRFAEIYAAGPYLFARRAMPFPVVEMVVFDPTIDGAPKSCAITTTSPERAASIDTTVFGQGGALFVHWLSRSPRMQMRGARMTKKQMQAYLEHTAAGLACGVSVVRIGPQGCEAIPVDLDVVGLANCNQRPPMGLHRYEKPRPEGPVPVRIRQHGVSNTIHPTTEYVLEGLAADGSVAWSEVLRREVHYPLPP